LTTVWRELVVSRRASRSRTRRRWVAPPEVPVPASPASGSGAASALPATSVAATLVAAMSVGSAVMVATGGAGGSTAALGGSARATWLFGPRDFGPAGALPAGASGVTASVVSRASVESRCAHHSRRTRPIQRGGGARLPLRPAPLVAAQRRSRACTPASEGRDRPSRKVSSSSTPSPATLAPAFAISCDAASSVPPVASTSSTR
jgi:hypothetical protein